METLTHAGREVLVREASRPAGKRWCRHLVSDGDEQHFLEYVISVGPYKIDFPVVYCLSEQEIAEHNAGSLKLGELAERLADADERARTYERPV